MNRAWIVAVAAVLLAWECTAVGDEQPAADFADLTPAEIADRIEETMGRFSSVEYEAEFSTVRDTNAFKTNAEPLLVTGTGSYLYRSDGRRWYADEHGFSVSVGKTEVNPRHTISGFDGKRHFHDDGSRPAFGEDSLTSLRLQPPAVFWRGSRTSDWLLAALRWQDAKVDRREKVNGADCLVVISARANNGNERVAESEVPQWKYEITISPSQSFLPIRTRVEYQGKLYSEETISELAQTRDGLWYPVKLSSEQHLTPIPTKSKSVHVKSLRIRDDFAARDFRHEVPLGRDIIDRTAGYAWHNDPWWEELRPWLRENVNWPRRDFRALADLRSYVEPDPTGKPAPSIAASQWLNRDPGDWNRADRKVTLLYFFGGRAIRPTPEQIGSIKALEARYRDSGLDVVGIVPGNSDPAVIQQTLDELDITFPVAIDGQGEAGAAYGLTFQAFHLRTYASTFVIDAEGIVHSLGTDSPPANAEISPVEVLVRQSLAAVSDSLPKPSSAVSHRLERKDFEEIGREWKRRVRTEKGQAHVRGSVLLTPGQPVAGGATVEIKPALWLLFSNTPGGWHVIPDRARFVKVLLGPNGNYSLDGLRRGKYTLTFSAPGLAAIERDVILGDDQSELVVDVHFSQGNEIKGVAVDATGKPVSGAVVKAIRRHFDPTTPDRYTTAHLPRQPRKTNDQGVFHFTDLFDGSYTFEVTAEGFETARTKPIGAGVADARVVLKPEANDAEPDDGARSVSEAVRGVNAEAKRHPVSRTQPPLTEQHVINVLGLLEQPEDLSEGDFAALKNIVTTRRLPKNVTLRPFLRYDDHIFVQHGWWVKLIMERKDRGPFGLWIRRQQVFTRPYTQAERKHHESVRETGGMTTLGRLVTWFDQDPKFNTNPPQSADYEVLVQQARRAIDNADAGEFLKLFHWESTDEHTQAFVEREVAAIMSREFQRISVERKRHTGELTQWQGFTRFGPNLPVEVYLEFVYAEVAKNEPVSLRLEAGEHAGKPKFVCHVVKEDRAAEFIGKKLSGPISVSGFSFQLADGWLEIGSTITAPKELPSLQQANLELWRIPL